MTREQRERAARVIESMRFDYNYNKNIDAIDTAIAVLREQGWVRTSERVPTEADDGEFGVVLAYNKALSKEDEMGLAACVCAWVVREGPEWWTYWMPLPALPEVEG